jgi:Tfp pilus assembly protein PilF
MTRGIVAGIVTPGVGPRVGLMGAQPATRAFQPPGVPGVIKAVKRDDASAAPDPAFREAIEHALAAAMQSRSFRGSPRHRTLLRYLVMQAMTGQTAALKETVIAVEVFARPVEQFDPRCDTIVRVETRRLRERLARYYANEGRGTALRIELPVGSYVPQFATHTGARGHAAATRRARDLVERGEHFLRQATSKAHLEQAIERFDQAQRESPTYAPACVGMARAWFNMASGWYTDPKPAGDHAIEALKRALDLEPDNATAWALLGAFQHQFEYDWPAARRSLRRAVSLAPDSAFVHTTYGWQLTARGELDAADRELSLARKLDPQYVNSRIHMVNLRVAQGRLEDAERELDAMRDIAPDSMVVTGMCAALALFRGEPERAASLYQRCREIAPDHPTVVLLLAAAHAQAGRSAQAQELRREAEARFTGRLISPYVQAILAVRSGERDSAMRWLAQALDEHDPQAVLFAHDPSFAPLHDDPRWPALRRRIGLAA